MKLLAFDASTSGLSVSVMDGHFVKASLTLEPGVDNRQQLALGLMPSIDRCLEESTLSKAELDLLVVGVGPGAFTGIRSAVIVGRTLGQVLNLPCFGVSRLESLAYLLGGDCAVVLRAGNQGYFCAAFDRCLNLESEPVFLSEDNLEAWLGSKARIFVEETECKETGLNSPCLKRLRPKGIPAMRNIAGIAAQFAIDALSKVSLEGSLGDPGEGQQLSRSVLLERFPWQNLSPLYLRSPSITLKKKNGP